MNETSWSGQELHGPPLDVAEFELSGRRHRSVEEVARSLGVVRSAPDEEQVNRSRSDHLE